MASENCRNTWRSLTLCSWQHWAYHQSGDEWVLMQGSQDGSLLLGGCKLEDKFDRLEIHHVLQHNNEAADALAKTLSAREMVLTRILPWLTPFVRLDDDSDPKSEALTPYHSNIDWVGVTTNFSHGAKTPSLQPSTSHALTRPSWRPTPTGLGHISTTSSKTSSHKQDWGPLPQVPSEVICGGRKNELHKESSTLGFLIQRDVGYFTHYLKNTLCYVCNSNSYTVLSYFRPEWQK